MKLIFSLLSLTLAAFFLMVGCETTSSNKKVENLPPSGSEVPTNAVPVEIPQVTAPITDDGSGKIIPVKDLPTYKGYPYAIKTKWAGLVKSPYAQDQKLVDVGSLPPNSAARCPHTGKIFIVP